MACHERKIRMLANLRSDYPYKWQEFEVSNHDMKYPYYRGRTVAARIVRRTTGSISIESNAKRQRSIGCYKRPLYKSTTPTISVTNYNRNKI